MLLEDDADDGDGEDWGRGGVAGAGDAKSGRGGGGEPGAGMAIRGAGDVTDAGRRRRRRRGAAQGGSEVAGELHLPFLPPPLACCGVRARGEPRPAVVAGAHSHHGATPMPRLYGVRRVELSGF